MKLTPRATALIVTLLAAAVTILLLMSMHLTVTILDREWPPRREGSIAMAEIDDEVLVDVIQDAPRAVHNDPAPAQNSENASNASDPAPATGHDLTDRGPAAEPPAPVTSKRPAPVKQQVKEKPAKTGPSKEELERQKAEEEARRRATAATQSAFSRASGKNNTANNGTSPGNSGSTTGTSQSVNGSGTGTVGGGWKMPAYAKVPATVTGSIKLMVRIDRTGRVTSVTFQGGDAPAATDARLKQAVEAEVRSRRFTRPDADDAPDQATAYITYRFK